MIEVVKDKLLNILRKKNFRKDVPVFCIGFKESGEGNFVCASNSRESKKIICGHAEINCINKLFKKNKSKNLKEYSLLVSMKPCEMCYFAMRQASIRKVFYVLDNPKNGSINIENNKFMKKINFVLFEDEYKKILSDFFKKMR